MVGHVFLSRKPPPIPRAHHFLIPTNQIKKPENRDGTHVFGLIR